MSASDSSAPRWVPLESNPEVMTKYNRTLGATAGEWVDVYGFDDSLLEMVPQPVHAVVLLFPITKQYDEYCKEQDDKLAQAGQDKISSDVFYMKQTVHNACGTVGVIHSLANNLTDIKLTDGKLKTFLDETAKMNPLERGLALENSNNISEAHEEIASEGQTEAPDREENLVTHFVAFIHKNGQLYEMDGRRQFPIDHGPTTASNLLKDAAKVCEERIKAITESGNGNEYRFTAVALTTGSQSQE